MSLLNTRHRDQIGAALSVASNRASKCELLRASAEESKPERADRLRAMADRNAESLDADVRDWLKRTAAGKRADEQTRLLLANIVARARGESAG